MLSGLAVLILVVAGGIDLGAESTLNEPFRKPNLPWASLTSIGIIELICLGIYLVPRSSALGAVLLTIGIAKRVGDGGNIIPPLVAAVMIWAAFLLPVLSGREEPR